MAKKVSEKDLVDCAICIHGGKVENHMLDCFNKLANPRGYKVGAWLKPCKYYKLRQNA